MSYQFYQGEMDERYEQLREKYICLLEFIREIYEEARYIPQPICYSETTEEIVREMDNFINDMVEDCEEILEKNKE